MSFPSSEDLATRCAGDGEFLLAARYWTGGLRLRMADRLAAMRIVDGVPSAGDPDDGPGVITLTGPDSIWAGLLAPVPPRFLNDILMAFELGLVPAADPVLLAQYYPAVMRAIELLRPASPTISVAAGESGHAPRFDAPVGRYVHLDLLGQDYRVYFEEAGSGIPMLLQHTAGCHGSQWRHLFERPEVTDHFRLIAYDLPFHGKSIPPVGPR